MYMYVYKMKYIDWNIGRNRKKVIVTTPTREPVAAFTFHILRKTRRKYEIVWQMVVEALDAFSMGT